VGGRQVRPQLGPELPQLVRGRGHPPAGHLGAHARAGEGVEAEACVPSLAVAGRWLGLAGVGSLSWSEVSKLVWEERGGELVSERSFSLGIGSGWGDCYCAACLLVYPHAPLLLRRLLPFSTSSRCSHSRLSCGSYVERGRHVSVRCCVWRRWGWVLPFTGGFRTASVAWRAS
jgi:hypothetical protein